MDLDHARDFVRTHHRAVLATRSTRGVQQSPVLVGVEDEDRAEMVSLPEAMDALVEYYRGISGEADDWDEYRAGMEREQRVLIRVTPLRAGPDRKA